MRDQGDLFWKGQTGKQLKDAALERFQHREVRWLERARAAMIALLGGGAREISSDDVWLLCPPPVDAHPSCMGAIFKHPAFETVGWKASHRPSAHARVIRTYKLKESI